MWDDQGLRRAKPSASRVGELHISYSLTAIFYCQLLSLLHVICPVFRTVREYISHTHAQLLAAI
jgi:hypothetical protein